MASLPTGWFIAFLQHKPVPVDGRVFMISKPCRIMVDGHAESGNEGRTAVPMTVKLCRRLAGLTALLATLVIASGCVAYTAASTAASVAGTAVSTTASVAGTAISTTASGVGAAADAVIGDDEDEAGQTD
jgi:hypothetical protein